MWSTRCGPSSMSTAEASCTADAAGRRALDVVVAVTGLVVLAPVALVIALVVRLTSRGPAFHRAERVGRDGRPFTLVKFRSMEVDAAAAGPGITAGGDRRVTRIGRTLRSTKLDEIPQLLNVLKGEMSVVGPRPEDSRYVDLYDAEQREILRWRPGITSPASIEFRDEEQRLAAAADLESAYREIMAEKIAIDLEYFRRAKVIDDFRVIGRTAGALLRRSGPA
jgi:lipopolysaccharide/colanic/teichoic acid biosynthesis glycosyltransferase